MKRNELRKAIDRVAHQERYFAYRVRVLPKQLEAARHKVRMLENEAARFGRVDLLEQTS